MQLQPSKHLLVLLLLTGLGQVSSGQGTVDFNNSNLQPPPNRRVFDAGCVALQTSNYVAALHFGPAGSPRNSLTPVAYLAPFAKPSAAAGGT